MGATLLVRPPSRTLALARTPSTLACTVCPPCLATNAVRQGPRACVPESTPSTPGPEALSKLQMLPQVVYGASENRPFWNLKCLKHIENILRALESCYRLLKSVYIKDVKIFF